MKKKTFRDEVVTKGYLTDELADFREGLVDQLDKRYGQHFNRILDGQDKIMKELETMREENAAGTLIGHRLQKKVEDHEKRIKKLESLN